MCLENIENSQGEKAPMVRALKKISAVFSFLMFYLDKDVCSITLLIAFSFSS